MLIREIDKRGKLQSSQTEASSLPPISNANNKDLQSINDQSYRRQRRGNKGNIPTKQAQMAQELYQSIQQKQKLRPTSEIQQLSPERSESQLMISDLRAKLQMMQRKLKGDKAIETMAAKLNASVPLAPSKSQDDVAVNQYANQESDNNQLWINTKHNSLQVSHMLPLAKQGGQEGVRNCNHEKLAPLPDKNMTLSTNSGTKQSDRNKRFTQNNQNVHQAHGKANMNHSEMGSANLKQRIGNRAIQNKGKANQNPDQSLSAASNNAPISIGSSKLNFPMQQPRESSTTKPISIGSSKLNLGVSNSANKYGGKFDQQISQANEKLRSSAMDKKRPTQGETLSAQSLPVLKNTQQNHPLPGNAVKESKQNGQRGPLVEMGLQRIVRLLEIKRMSIEHVDKVLIQGKFIHAIKIRELADIFRNKLGLNQKQSIAFARFVIEGKEQASISEDVNIKYMHDLNKEINSHQVPQRLQSFIKKQPVIYTDEEEKAVIQKFSEVFSKADQRKLSTSINQHDQALIPFEIFKKKIIQVLGDNYFVKKGNQYQQRLKNQELECAYVYLCRGIRGPFVKSEVDSITSAEMCKRLQGYAQKDTNFLFEDVQAKQQLLGQPRLEIQDVDAYESQQKGDKIENEANILKRQKIAQKHQQFLLAHLESNKPYEVQAKKQATDKQAPGANNQTEVQEPKDDKNEEKQGPYQIKNESKFFIEDSIADEVSNRQWSQQQSPKASAKSLSLDMSIGEDLDAEEDFDNAIKDQVATEHRRRSTLQSKSKAKANADDSNSPIKVSNVKSEVSLPAAAKENEEKQGDKKKAKEEESPFELAKDIHKPQAQEPKSSFARFVLPTDDDQAADIGEIPHRKSRNEAKNAVSQYHSPTKAEGASSKAPTDPQGTPVQTAQIAAEAENQQDKPKAEVDDKPEENKVEDNPEADNNLLQDETDSKEENKQEKEARPSFSTFLQVGGNPADERADLRIPDAERQPSESSEGDSDDSESEEPAPVTFSADQIHELQKALTSIYKQHAEGKKHHLDSTNAIIQTSNVLSQFAGYVLGYYKELKECCREIFRDVVYTIRDKDLQPVSDLISQASVIKSRKSNKKENLKAPEVEVMKVDDLAFKIDEAIAPEELPLQQSQIQAIALVFSVSKYGGMIKYTDMLQALKPLGIIDRRAPPGFANQAHLNYDTLDFQSIRLLNRLIHHLGTYNISFSKYFGDLVQTQEVKTKASTSQVQIFMAKKFFQKLHKSGIKKTAAIHTNLAQCLCIDPKYKNYLMLKKLKRCIIDFNQSRYLQSVGMKKMKLTPEEEAYMSGQLIPADFDTATRLDQPMEPVGLVPQPGQTEDPDAAQYEYYDEEDDGEAEGEQQRQEQQLEQSGVASASSKVPVAAGATAGDMNMPTSTTEAGNSFTDTEVKEIGYPYHQNIGTPSIDGGKVKDDRNARPMSITESRTGPMIEDQSEHLKTSQQEQLKPSQLGTSASSLAIQQTQSIPPQQIQPQISHNQPSAQQIAQPPVQATAPQPATQLGEEEYGDEYYDEEADGEEQQK